MIEKWVIRKVCTSPKAAETRALMRIIDDGKADFAVVKHGGKNKSFYRL